jgi:hypothetical protein
MAIPRCGSTPVAFLPQISGPSADFWAKGPRLPNPDHAAATRLPQISIGG